MADVSGYDVAGAALATTELLENILLHLPIRDVLVFQCVSTTWKRTIKTSPRIQQKLFLKPAAVSEFWVTRSCVAEEMGFSLKLKSGETNDQTVTPRTCQWIVDAVPASNKLPPVDDNKEHHIIKGEFNKMLLFKDESWTVRKTDIDAETKQTHCTPSLYHFMYDFDVLKSLAKSSCMPMLLTQPPCQKVRVVEPPEMRVHPFPAWREFTICREEGVRCSDIVDEIRRQWSGVVKRDLAIGLADIVCPTETDEEELAKRFVDIARMRAAKERNEDEKDGAKKVKDVAAGGGYRPDEDGGA